MGLSSRGWKRKKLLRVVVASLPFLVVSGVVNNQQAEGAVRSFPYLYGVEGNPNASHPVMEHLAPSHRPGYDPDVDVDEDDRPDFLFTATGTYRIVEFYVHWCDVCKNFKPHYIQLGRSIQQLGGGTVEVHAVSCAPNRPLCRALSIDRYPYFRVYTPGDTSGVVVPHAQVNPAYISQKMGIFVGEDANDWHGDRTLSDAAMSWLDWGEHMWTRWTSNPDMAGKADYKQTRDELRDDVHLSFDYAMHQGVFVSDDPLTEERAERLLAWLLLLRQTLPLSWAALHAGIQELLDNFDYVKRSESYMVALLKEHPPPSTVWSMACSHGEADAGYTCGLWELFHVVTVGVVDFNRGAVFAANCLATESVAFTIRNYIDSFFGCEICRRNFVSAFDSCAYRRCDRLSLNATKTTETDWIQLPLWLFETHNAVNVRLLKERAAREHRPIPTVSEETAVMWPPGRDCPSCWLPTGETWNDHVIYKYLKLEYGQRDALSLEYKQELFPPPEAVEPQPSRYRPQVDWWTPVKTWITAMPTTSINPKRPSGRTLEDLQINVHRSFDFVLRNEVYKAVTGPLDNEARKALLDWLSLLSKTMPSSWTAMHSLVDDMLDNFDYAARTADYLTAVLDDYPPNNTEFTTSCSHMCGLWETFHVVTIGVVHHNKFIAATDLERLATAVAADSIRTFVHHFLSLNGGWSEFVASFDMCGHGRCNKLLKEAGTERDWVHLPIWIYEVRNTVNLHLLMERSVEANREVTRQDEIAMKWPSIEECRRCWLENGKLDTDMIYKFLLLEYGPQNALTTGLHEELWTPPVGGVKSTLLGIQSLLRGWLMPSFQPDAKQSEYILSPAKTEAGALFALDCMLRNYVYRESAPLIDIRRAALKDWLDLLQKTMPASWHSMHTMLEDLLANFIYVTKTKDYLVAVLDEYQPDQSLVVAGRPDEDANMGISRGVWDLLHVATVGAVEFNRDASYNQRLPTETAARTIKVTLEHFLDCDICDRTFDDFFDGCKRGQCGRLSVQPGSELDWIQLPLWLAKMHNAVKRRSPEEAQWPTKKVCGSCWFDDGHPNEEATYAFLESLYGAQGVVETQNEL